jgi:hypothetical protein
MIRVVNLRNYKPVKGEVLIKIDRSSVLGNPFKMYRESQRDLVCDQYADRFVRITTGEVKNEAFMNELRRIYKVALKQDVALGCWCYPQRCHGLTIKEYLDRFLRWKGRA